MPEVVHLIIKKQYAASVIENLRKEQAIEIVEPTTEDIPGWQKEAVRQTLKEVENNPGQLQPWEVIKEKYKRP